LIVPVRRLHKWAKDAKVEWAVDDNVEMPTQDELDKLPVEDTGVSFSYSVKADAAAGGNPHTIIIGDGKSYYLGDRDTELKFPTYLRYIPNAKVTEKPTSDSATKVDNSNELLLRALKR